MKKILVMFGLILLMAASAVATAAEPIKVTGNLTFYEYSYSDIANEHRTLYCDNCDYFGSGTGIKYVDITYASIVSSTKGQEFSQNNLTNYVVNKQKDGQTVWLHSYGETSPVKCLKCGTIVGTSSFVGDRDIPETIYKFDFASTDVLLSNCTTQGFTLRGIANQKTNATAACTSSLHTY